MSEGELQVAIEESVLLVPRCRIQNVGMVAYLMSRNFPVKAVEARVGRNGSGCRVEFVFERSAELDQAIVDWANSAENRFLERYFTVQNLRYDRERQERDMQADYAPSDGS